MCRSRRELSNEYLLAKFGFDTAENEPCKACPLSAYRSPRFSLLVYSARDSGLLFPHDHNGPESWFYLKETFGAQVFLLVLGYFITMRMNFALNRWDSAYQGVSLMMGKWSD